MLKVEEGREVWMGKNGRIISITRHQNLEVWRGVCDVKMGVIKGL